MYLTGSDQLRQATSILFSTLIFSTHPAFHYKPGSSNAAKANQKLYHNTNQDCSHVANGNGLLAAFLGTFHVSNIGHASQFEPTDSVVARYPYQDCQS
jgi:hypothetical protein